MTRMHRCIPGGEPAGGKKTGCSIETGSQALSTLLHVNLSAVGVLSSMGLQDPETREVSCGQLLAARFPTTITIVCN